MIVRFTRKKNEYPKVMCLRLSSKFREMHFVYRYTDTVSAAIFSWGSSCHGDQFLYISYSLVYHRTPVRFVPDRREVIGERGL